MVRLNELNSITNERDCAHKDFEDMRKRRFDEFMAGFTVITSKLKEMYQVGLYSVELVVCDVIIIHFY